MRSLFVSGIYQKEATTRAGSAIVAERDKVTTPQRQLRNVLNVLERETIAELNWPFFVIAFDTYGASAFRTSILKKNPAI